MPVGDRRAGQPPRDSRSRRAARGAATAIAPSGASASDWHNIRSVRYGCMRHPLPLAGAQRARLVPDRVRDAEPPEVVTQTGAVERPDIGPAPSRVSSPAAAASSATARAWPSVYGDFRSTKFATATQRVVEPLSRQHHVSAGSASITASHVAIASRPAKIASASARRSPPARDRTAPRRACGPAPARAVDSAHAGGRPRRTRRAATGARRSAPARRSSPPGQPLPSHCSYAAASASSTASDSPSCSAERPRHLGVVVDHRRRRRAARRARTRARSGSDATAGCPPRAGASPRPPRAGRVSS